MGGEIPPLESARYEQLVADARAALGDTAFDAAWSAGEALPPETAITEALEGSG